ncbi:MAG: carboxypeptidase regulatory-like domain-containing protein, partial [Bryobacteraceae bacterium]|nr:carboxypeptidase regulatory-like domain-containing protein [Bryobacteraceae bacterium]
MKLMGHLRHKAAICLSVAAAAWMLAGPGQMPSSRGTVSGRITDREGRPIPGVQVMVAGERSVTVTTDPSGRYRAEGLEPGRY